MRWEEYASGSRIDHFAWWCETYLVQSIDQFAGLPLRLEDWQLEFMGEALATNDPLGAEPSWNSKDHCQSNCYPNKEKSCGL